ncbi:MAG: ferritin-like domain-containing protein [Janthinobacterium lividum]
MPTQETRFLDDVILSRRTLLAGSAALAATSLIPQKAAAQSAVASYSDNDILNFALNLEYLEANFYYLAAFGTTIEVGNGSSTAANAPVLGINGVAGNNPSGSGMGVVANSGVTGAPASSTYKVPFASPVLAAYAVETAVEEGKHVSLLRTALGSLAVAQPAINLTPNLFDTLAGLAGVPSSLRPFNPYANEAYFLLGAYIFEDVGVSAYHGAAPLITGKTTILPVAAGIHAVEAYHAGLIRYSLIVADAAATYAPAGTLSGVTTMLSAFRNSAAQAKPQVNNPLDPNPDDYGTANQMVTLNSTTSVAATQIVNAGPASSTAPAISFGRSTSQVLNIVTAGGANTGAVAKGGFFPQGLNGLFI